MMRTASRVRASGPVRGDADRAQRDARRPGPMPSRTGHRDSSWTVIAATAVDGRVAKVRVGDGDAEAQPDGPDGDAASSANGSRAGPSSPSHSSSRPSCLRPLGERHGAGSKVASGKNQTPVRGVLNRAPHARACDASGIGVRRPRPLATRLM